MWAIILVLGMFIISIPFAAMVHVLVWASNYAFGFAGALVAYFLELWLLYAGCKSYADQVEADVQAGNLDGPVGFFAYAIGGWLAMLAIAIAILNAIGLCLLFREHQRKFAASRSLRPGT